MFHRLRIGVNLPCFNPLQSQGSNPEEKPAGPEDEPPAIKEVFRYHPLRFDWTEWYRTLYICESKPIPRF